MKVTLQQRLRYRVDNALARGLWVVLLWLAGLTAVFVSLVAFAIWISGVGPGDSGTSFGDGIWLAITRSLDPGTFSGDEGSRFRLVMLLVTIIGIFLGATIIGLISSSIDSRLEELRRGRSLVVEQGHTLIIGYSDKLPVIISELVEANRSERGRAVVVLTSRDTVEVTQEIRRDVKDLATTRLVVRSGTPTRLNDLARVSPQTAKAAIVLSEEGSESAAEVVKVVLGLHRLIGTDGTCTIVAELDNTDIADGLRDAIGEGLITVTPSQVVARITAQVSRASGLGAIYQEVLDFDGDELYAKPIPASLHGMCFGQLVMASSLSTIIGIRKLDGRVFVNPPPDTPIESGDLAIAIAEDDSIFTLDRVPEPWQVPDDRAWKPLPVRTERALIIGWSQLAPLIIRELETHVARGSELVILIDEASHEIDDVMADLRRLDLANQVVSVRTGDPISRGSVNAVLEEGPYDHVMLLCDRENFGVDQADARVLLTLMQVRTSDHPAQGNVVAELLDPNDVELATQGDRDDFIVSQRLISLLLAQLSQSPHLVDVFDDLFDSEGTAIALHPASRYLPVGQATFNDVVAAVRSWGVVAIGYRSAAASGRPDCLPGGVRVNPSKDEVIHLGDGDQIVVITNTR